MGDPIPEIESGRACSTGSFCQRVRAAFNQSLLRLDFPWSRRIKETEWYVLLHGHVISRRHAMTAFNPGSACHKLPEENCVLCL
jgi:hypothetical protein